MCRLDSSVCACVCVCVCMCVCSHGGREGNNVAVESHTQYRHKPSSLYAEIAHHDCPLAPLCGHHVQ